MVELPLKEQVLSFRHYCFLQSKHKNHRIKVLCYYLCILLLHNQTVMSSQFVLSKLQHHLMRKQHKTVHESAVDF